MSTAMQNSKRKGLNLKSLNEVMNIVQTPEEEERKKAADASKKRSLSAAAKTPEKFKFIDKDISNFSEKYDDIDIRDHFAAVSRNHRRMSCKKEAPSTLQTLVGAFTGGARTRSKSLGKLKISSAPSEAPSNGSRTPSEDHEKSESGSSYVVVNIQETAEEILADAEKMVDLTSPITVLKDPNAKKARKSDFMIKREVEISETLLFSPRGNEEQIKDKPSESFLFSPRAINEQTKDQLPLKDLDSIELSEDAAEMESQDLDDFNESGKFGKISANAI